jgi:hypothetical protein
MSLARPSIVEMSDKARPSIVEMSDKLQLVAGIQNSRKL